MMKSIHTTKLITFFIVTLFMCGPVYAASTPDPFYLPQPEQSFEGTVHTRIGTLKFNNQYPSKDSMESILDNMDFHGATQAYLWGIPIASFANLQYYSDKVWKFRQGENWFAYFRLYAPTEKYFDRSWPIHNIKRWNIEQDK